MTILRRRLLGGLACLTVGIEPASAQIEKVASDDGRSLREMQVHKVPALGLEIWVENQPPWDVQLTNEPGRPTFVAKSPNDYHPPTVMSYVSFPREKVQDDRMQLMALSAIRRASMNFGLTEAQSRSINPNAASYGVLRGFEGVFIGKAHGSLMDVQIFVGQAPGRFPVVLTMYTMRDKLPNLVEQRRRAWTKLQYLGRKP